jgi:hypothetical protein
VGGGVSVVMALAIGVGAGVGPTESGEGSALVDVVDAGVDSGAAVGLCAGEEPAKRRSHVVRTKRRMVQEISKSQVEKQLFSACERQEFRSC